MKMPGCHVTVSGSVASMVSGKLRSAATALQVVNAELAADDGLETVMLPMADSLTIARKSERTGNRETEPDVTSTDGTFPLTGQVWRVDYGEMVIEHDYRAPDKISYTQPDGQVLTTDLSVTPIRDDVFVLRFQDPHASMFVVEDLAARTVNAFMLMRDQTTMHLTGTLRPVVS